MKHVAYIHGMNQTSVSFNYLIDKLPKHHVHRVDYRSHAPLTSSIDEVAEQLPVDCDLTLVGHSLGGLISIFLAEKLKNRVKSVVTISSPLGGSRAASTVRWLPTAPPVLHDVTITSPYIRHLLRLKLGMPTLSIISTEGGVLTSEPNDGVVTVASQRALGFGEKVEVKTNHFEVLLHEDTSRLLNEFIFQ